MIKVMKTDRIIEVVNVISAWEAIAEWEAIKKKYRGQETDLVFLYKPCDNSQKNDSRRFAEDNSREFASKKRG